MTDQNKVIICGGGKIGHMAALFLSESGDYEVKVLDNNDQQFEKFKGFKNVVTEKCDISNQKELEAAAKGYHFMLSTAPYTLTTVIANAAKNVEAHYIDLTEDIAASEIVKDVASKANSAFIPQSGLAPGFISILAADLCKEFDALDDVRMRVGALTKHPNNAIKYNLTWSTAGLVNEYCEPCNAVVDGKLVQVEPLQGAENFSLDGIDYEAFNTSGGLGTLAETLAGKVKNLNYKSIRYPGHLGIMKFLINDLKLKHKKEVLIDILDEAIPSTKEDVVLVYVSVSGTKNKEYVQETRAIKIYATEMAGMACSGIQLTTAGAACAVIDLVREGTLPQKGFIKQEDIPLDAFLKNRFGRVYAPGEISATEV